jgi:hypothetical protein
VLELLYNYEKLKFWSQLMSQSRHATDQEIQKWVFQHHGLKIETDWITHCKEL